MLAGGLPGLGCAAALEDGVTAAGALAEALAAGLRGDEALAAWRAARRPRWRHLQQLGGAQDSAVLVKGAVRSALRGLARKWLPSRLQGKYYDDLATKSNDLFFSIVRQH